MPDDSRQSAVTEAIRLTRDGWLLFVMRAVRMFAYGLISVILLFYLAAAGLDPSEQGLLLTLTLFGDTGISLWLVTRADRFGRRRTLLAGAFLMLIAGLVFSTSTGFLVLLVAATIGVISPNGTEVGPFLSVEQAALSEIVAPSQRTMVYAWYHVVGISASALGALTAGQAVAAARQMGLNGIDAYRPVLWAYALAGLVLAVLSSQLQTAIETRAPPSIVNAPKIWGLHRSRGIVTKLSLLFMFDAFGGGFIMQSIIAYWFHHRFGVSEGQVGQILFAANLLAGGSALLAGRLAKRFGLINTMVFTHLPSNVLLLILPFIPDVRIAIGVLLLRFSISQMDVPTRQAFTMAVVASDERSAAAGVTSVARSMGAAVAPVFSAPLVASMKFAALPFVIAGSIKIVYDLILFAMFSRHRETVEEDPGISEPTSGSGK